MNQPIKRHKAIQPLSRDHHQGLLLCWKIREGLKRNVEPQRIKKFTDWFWQNHLMRHFEEEEQFLFAIPGFENVRIRQAMEEHRQLKTLFENNTDVLTSLEEIQNLLERHIRFEERVLFNEIQKMAADTQLESLKLTEGSPDAYEEWDDAFWK